MNDDPIPLSTGPTTIEIACELAEFGVQMVAATSRREHLDATDDQVQQHANAWWQDRPGAPHGDAPGRVVTDEPQWRKLTQP